MNHCKSALCCLLPSALLLSFPASRQSRRWLLSFNPLGVLEPRSAIGLGAGLKISRRVELWSETSMLGSSKWVWHYRDVSGMRQLAQLRYYLPGDANYFIAGAGRGKE